MTTAADLTRTQRDALGSLAGQGHVWPTGRGYMAVSGAGVTYSRRTLQALVDAGLARWEHRDGVMPHIVATR